VRANERPYAPCCKGPDESISLVSRGELGASLVRVDMECLGHHGSRGTSARDSRWHFAPSDVAVRLLDLEMGRTSLGWPAEHINDELLSRAGSSYP